MSQNTETLEKTVHTTSEDEAASMTKKKEKRTELAPGVPLGTPLYNKLYGILSVECQCRPQVCPLVIAQLAAAWEAEVAIVVGENNPEYNKKIFDSHRDLIGEISLDKIKTQPLRSTVQVFGYESIRPKREPRERAVETDEEHKAKRSKKTKVDSEGNVINE